MTQPTPAQLASQVSDTFLRLGAVLGNLRTLQEASAAVSALAQITHRLPNAVHPIGIFLDDQKRQRTINDDIRLATATAALRDVDSAAQKLYEALSRASNAVKGLT